MMKNLVNIDNLLLKINNFIKSDLKNIEFLKDVLFKAKKSEEFNNIELLYRISGEDTAIKREEIYNTISNIVYSDFQKNEFTKDELDFISILYDYFDEIYDC